MVQDGISFMFSSSFLPWSVQRASFIYHCCPFRCFSLTC